MRKDLVWATGVTVGVLIFGALFTIDLGQRDAVGGDSLEYLKMAAGQTAHAPYAGRPLAPLLARLVGGGELGLQIITYLGLGLAYVASLVLARKAGLSRWAASLGLLVVFGSTAHIYNYENPFLTDGLALGFTSLAVLALVVDSRVLFALSILVGTAAREAVAGVAAIWLGARPAWVAFATGLAALLVAGLLRFLPAGPLVYAGPISLQQTVLQIGRSWGVAWLLLLLGLFWLSAPVAWRLRVAAAVMTVEGLVAAFIFRDTARMLLGLFPFMVLAAAQVVDVANRQAKVAVAALLAASLGGVVVNYPNLIAGEGSALLVGVAAELPVAAVGLAGVLWVAAAYRHRESTVATPRPHG